MGPSRTKRLIMPTVSQSMIALAKLTVSARVHQAEGQHAVGSGEAQAQTVSTPSEPACKLLALASLVTALPVTGNR